MQQQQHPAPSSSSGRRSSARSSPVLGLLLLLSAGSASAVRHIPSTGLSSDGLSMRPMLRRVMMQHWFISPNASGVCANHSRSFLEEIGELTPWALQMLDASAKIPSGILDGNFAWWGSFSECLEVTARLDDPGYGAPPDFVGQYCTVSLTAQTDANATGTIQEILYSFDINVADSSQLALGVGLCVPSTCTEDDVRNNLQHIADLMNVSVQVETKNCQSKYSYKLDSAGIAVLCLWGSFLLLILLGTIYEISTILKKRCWCVRQTISESSFAESPSMNPLYCSNSEENLTKTSIWSDFFYSFSAIANGGQILKVGDVRGSLSALHGIRFLSMAWIVLGHTYYQGIANAPLWDNVKVAAVVIHNFVFQIVIRGVLGVDTFLFISGMLVVYVSLKKMKATNGKFNIVMFYLHRLIRLSPVYMMTIAWVAGPSDYVLAGGPLWPQVAQYKSDCQQTWWKNILYISNFGDTTHMCLPHSWYISLDMQLYILTPILLYPLYRFPRVGVALTVLCTLASCITAGVISYLEDLPTSSVLPTVPMDNLVAYSTDFYIKPYCRMGPYGVGMLFGYLLLKEDFKNKIKPPLTYILWAVAICCNLSVLYGTYGQFLTTQPPPILSSAIYNALSGTVWAIGIGWLTYACIIGYGGFINTILSWHAWVPLSRLTYCCYLLHMIVLYTFFGSRENKFHFDQLLMIMIYLAVLVMTCGISFIFSLVFESPFIQLEKLARERLQQHQKKDSKIPSRQYGTS